MDQTRFFVFDASVLIDFCGSDKTLLKLISTKIAPIWSPRAILEEVRQLSENDFSDLKITLFDSPFSELVEAKGLTEALSVPDRLCYILARNEKVPCVTSDRGLRKFCLGNNIKTFWGLEPLLWLVAKGVLAKEDALKTASTIHTNNPMFITKNIIQTFTSKLRSL